MGNVGGLLSPLLEHSISHVGSENHKSVFDSHRLEAAKAEQCILKACPRNFASVDCRPTDQFLALSLVEKDVARAEHISLELLGCEVHGENIGDVDPIFLHI